MQSAAYMTENDAGQVWREAREARVRSLYFGEMLSRYMRRKQWVVGLSLGLSSGAVIAAIGGHWSGLAPVLAATVAILNAWSISANLDQQIVTLARLQSSWEDLRIEYDDVWSRWYEEDAAARFMALQRRANELGVLASSGTPWDQKAVTRWEEFVYSELRENAAAG